MRNLFYLNKVIAVLLVFALAPPIPARNKKGDRYLKDGRVAENREEYEKALDLYEKAVLEDPGEAAYQLAMRRVRFQAGQSLVDKGRKLREEGKLDEALREFQKAFAIDPSSSIAEQELRRTMQMIEREKKKAAGEADPSERGLTPVELARKEVQERIAAALPVPELKPISPQINTLKMTNQPVKVLFETVGKLPGINVVFDPDFQEPPGKRFSVDFANTTLEQALDYLGVITKSFWKPLSSNMVFVTNDNVTKRRDYEDHVVKVFYLQNVTTVQELQEIATTIRSVTDIRRLFTYNAQSAIVVRASANQVALAELLIANLDKPKAEVVVDIMVMEANKTRTRDIAATLTSGSGNGINIPIGFTPRNPVLTNPGSGSDSDSGSASTTSSAIALGQIGKITENDFSLTLPGYFVQLLMSDRSTRVLQQPQLRAADGTKATIHIGDRYPYATGSFQPGLGVAGGVSPLVSTQFQFAEIGVKVDMTPRIHGDKEVSLHVEAEISSVRDNIDVGGLKQPVIGQRRVVHDLRLREGEVSVIGGLMQGQDTKVMSGLPGLADIPIIKRLFSSENVEKSNAELLFVMIPHIVRAPEITDVNLKGVAAGNDQSVQLSFAPRAVPAEAPTAPVPAAPAPAPVKPPATEAPKPDAPSATPAVPPAAPVAPVAVPTVRFNPATINVQPGAVFTVTVEVANASNLFAAPLRVKFDPKLLRLNEVTQGALLSQDGQPALFTRNILNDAGEASVTLSRQGEAAGVSGSGTLVSLNFQAIGKGAARVELAEIRLQHPKNQPVQGAAAATPATVNIQ